MNNLVKTFLTITLFFSVGFIQGCKDNSTTPASTETPDQKGERGGNEKKKPVDTSKVSDEHSFDNEELVVSEDNSINSIFDALSNLGLDFIYDENSVKVIFREEVGKETFSSEEILNNDLQKLGEVHILLSELTENTETSTILSESAKTVKDALQGRIELLEKLLESYSFDENNDFI